jgi:putative nucleotidyltransferase with HDIG domain
MPTIPLSQLRPGLVLAADVESPDGKYHFPAGQVLSSAHVHLLRGWHRPEVEVEEVPAPDRAAAEVGSGPVSPEDATRARFAHLSLAEPVSAALLELALARAEPLKPDRPLRLPAPRVHAPGDVPSLEQLLAGDPMLVSLPEVFMRIREVVSDPGSTVEEATAVIGKDPSLTAKLLKLVNSAFYARTLRISGGLPPGRVDTLSRAVMLLGLNQLSTLAMGVSVLPLFKDIPAECIDMRQFWRHSVAVGVVTKLLAVRMGDPSPERFFVAGLLHDIGRLVLFKQAPGLAAEALGLAGREGRLLLDVEREIFGFDHAELGGRLLRKWRFPESLEQAVWRHHTPMAGEVPQEPSLVCVADMVAGAVLPGCSGEHLVPRLQAEAWNTVWLTAEDLPELVETAGAHFEVVCSMFF